TMFDVPGTFEAIHKIADILAVAYRTEHGTECRVFVDGNDTGETVGDIEAAIVLGIAYRSDGPGSNGDTYFFRMIGAEDDERPPENSTHHVNDSGKTTRPFPKANSATRNSARSMTSKRT